MKTNREPAVLAVEAAAQEVLQSVKRARTNLPVAQKSRYLRNLAGDALSREERGFSVNAMLRLLYDAMQRGATEADLQQVPSAFSEAIHKWYAVKDQLPEYPHAHAEAERAEAEVEIAEAGYQENPCGLTLQKMRFAKQKSAMCAVREVRAAEKQIYTPFPAA